MATTETTASAAAESGNVDTGDGFRSKPSAIRTRAAALGLKWSARALATHCRINRHTAQKLLNGQPINQVTMAKVLTALAPGEPIETLFEVIAHPDGQG